jgi:hypothetical protein
MKTSRNTVINVGSLGMLKLNQTMVERKYKFPVSHVHSSSRGSTQKISHFRLNIPLSCGSSRVLLNPAVCC